MSLTIFYGFMDGSECAGIKELYLGLHMLWVSYAFAQYLKWRKVGDYSFIVEQLCVATLVTHLCTPHGSLFTVGI